MSPRIADLWVGARFTAPVRGKEGAIMMVVTLQPSRMQEGQTRLEVKYKSGRIGVLVLPDDMPVKLFGRKPSPAKAKHKVENVTKQPVIACTCRNHMGTKKHLHKTREAAVAAILHHHLRYGGHSIYECPTGLGWHVRSQKLKLDT